jgi:hypothetical protein
MTALEIAVFTKRGGPLTKRISLAGNGSLKNDSSACIMSRGTASRFGFTRIGELAELITRFGPDQALTLGVLRSDLPAKVEVVTKRKLNGGAGLGVIARTADYLTYRPGAPALALVDYDTKGMPTSVAEKIEELGGFWPALTSVIPEIAGVARVMRNSTSAGLFRTDTGQLLPGTGGTHVFLAVQDGKDVERFLKALHARCWLAGYGWMMVGAGGQLLDRSIVDRVVGSPERLVFEGAPVLDPPLAQNKEVRRPVVTEGQVLDSIAACPPLTILEMAKLDELHAKEALRLGPLSGKARKTFVAEHAERLAQRTGMTPARAARIIERQCAGVLLPDVVLLFDDEDLAGATVADVLADPTRFEDATLADPIEGVEYGTGKAKVLLHPDGTPWINSFAHGRTRYELRFDYSAAATAVEKAPKDEIAEAFIRLVLAGDLGEDEIEGLRNLTHQRTGINKRTLDQKLKAARRAADLRRARQERDQRLANRQDPRPRISAPYADAEWLPTLGVLDGVLGRSTAIEPPMRDFEGYVIEARARRVQGLHALTSWGSNKEDSEETRLPPPDQLLLSRLSEPALAELIERHVEFFDERNRPVHLGTAFVKHYVHRPNDEALPLCTGLSAMPIVLPHGGMLSGPGLMRRYNMLFRVPLELCTLLPTPEDCTAPVVSRAMRFLTHEWLCDVATSYEGRCIVVACALTIIERALLPMRPAFFVRAGKRGGGKTTTLNMISTAVLDHTAAAAAWSPNEEERRKALFAYFLEGVPFLVWDNVARGTTVSCPSIEKSLTAEFYTDRVLGVSERKLVPITTVQAFTGNNIAPRGDMSSRSLQVIIGVDRPDPENRQFTHPDPIGWTKVHRGRILSALYTVLLGNPRRRPGHKAARLETRFKEWMDLVGSAVEYAAGIVVSEIESLVADPLPTCPPSPISFKTSFLEGEAEDQEEIGLATLLCALRSKWWKARFHARAVAIFLQPENSPPTDEAREMLAALNLAAGRLINNVSPSRVTWSLKKLVDAPVQVGQEVLILKCHRDRKHGDEFSVENVD